MVLNAMVFFAMVAVEHIVGWRTSLAQKMVCVCVYPSVLLGTAWSIYIRVPISLMDKNATQDHHGSMDHHHAGPWTASP